MSTAGAVLLIVATLATCSVLAYGLYLHDRRAREKTTEDFTAPAEEGEEGRYEPHAPLHEEPRLIDENDPPRYSHYLPDVYHAERAPRCSCHQRPIKRGERVLLWPIPDHPDGAIDIFCEETYGQVSP